MNMQKELESLKLIEQYSEVVRQQPQYHKEVPMGSHVLVPDNHHKIFDKETGEKKKLSGKVSGISSYGVVFTYIVILDEPMPTEYGPMKAISVHGPLLVGVDGKHWRLDE